MNSDNTRELLIEAANRAANYIEGLSVRDVRPLRGSVERLMEVLDGPLPDNPSRPADVLALLDDYGSPATVASAGGRYFGFVTGGALPVTVAAQYLAAGWDQNCFSFISSPAVACIESTALRWVKERSVCRRPRKERWSAVPRWPISPAWQLREIGVCNSMVVGTWTGRVCSAPLRLPSCSAKRHTLRSTRFSRCWV